MPPPQGRTETNSEDTAFSGSLWECGDPLCVSLSGISANLSLVSLVGSSHPGVGYTQASRRSHQMVCLCRHGGYSSVSRRSCSRTHQPYAKRSGRSSPGNATLLPPKERNLHTPVPLERLQRWQIHGCSATSPRSPERGLDRHAWIMQL